MDRVRVPLLPAEGPVPAALADWLAPHLGTTAADRAGAMQAQQIVGGQSNPSWVLRQGERAWVLRAKPAPAAQLLPSAHAIEREFRVQYALAGSEVPVPTMRVLCEDENVAGVAFYVMDYVPGRVLRDATLATLPLAQRPAYHQQALHVLAALHQVDVAAAGLGDYGRSEQFFQRLARRWAQQYRSSAAVAGPIAAMEALADWLPPHIPPGAEDPRHICLTHGDFRLENLMFHPSEPRVLAVLDWELSTLGHPLSDLAYHCLAWHLPSGILRGFGDLDHAALGIPSEHDTVASYCAQTGHALNAVLAHWPFYLACNLFRLGAILAGIAARERAGTAANPTAAEIGRMATPVAELGWAIATGRAPALQA